MARCHHASSGLRCCEGFWSFGTLGSRVGASPGSFASWMGRHSLPHFPSFCSVEMSLGPVCSDSGAKSVDCAPSPSA